MGDGYHVIQRRIQLGIENLVAIPTTISLRGGFGGGPDESGPVGIGGLVIINRESAGYSLQLGAGVFGPCFGKVENPFGGTIIGRDLQLNGRAHHSRFRENGQDNNEHKSGNEH